MKNYHDTNEKSQTPDIPRSISELMASGLEISGVSDPVCRAPCFRSTESGNEYDVTPDGTQFVMVTRNQETIVEVMVILNWFEELERMVPAER